MILFYVRHGNPIYDPDSLTPLGERQAEAIGKRLALFGMNRIYASTSVRAKQTAKPLSELLQLPVEELGFANEGYAWRDLSVCSGGARGWAFQDKECRMLFTDPSVRAMAQHWYQHPKVLEKNDFAPGIERIYREADAFFASLGFEHERYTGRYRVTGPNDERVAFFAHQGFGLAFLSAILDIPYPVFCTQFDMSHSSLTVIDFADEGGFAIPRVCTLSDTGHLYREGLPLTYNGGFSY